MAQAFFCVLIIVLFVVVAIPATLSLPKGKRGSIRALNISTAVDELKRSNKKDWELVVQTTLLVHHRMQYCRRNSFDSYRKAFERGYGYCQQQAYALTAILRQLGYNAKVVHSLNVKLANGKRTSHAWVEVSIGHEKRFYCPVFPDPDNGMPTFRVLGKVYNYNSFFRLLAGWGAIGINAIKYYFIGDGV